MDKNGIHIDERDHERVPSLSERLKHSLIAILLGFFLINIIAFWMFPGLGLAGIYIFSSAHSLVALVGEMSNVIIITLLVIFGMYGWFRGRYFIRRLQDFIEWWRFW
jgi:hypothetical protein